MTYIIMPNHLNALDTVFGGQVMAWIDVCAGVSAQRFTKGTVVTASMDHLTFLAPIRKGDVTVLRSQVNWAGRTSLEVGVRVEAEDIRTGERRHTSSAYLTMVSLDDGFHPRQTPTLVPQTPDEIRRFEDAQHRRAVRLEQRERARLREERA
ncbi:MAG: acyl-CoA thioesterase [Alphaproteobacteria bacterium]|nr:acyl-CoA thioesterase [Alphaproteobacteria bacterium]MCB9690726.1 acyl-CoA thioesterase [Alphaproteobacteria bacterium]